MHLLKADFPLPIRSTRSSPTKRSGTGLVGIGRASYPIFFDMSKWIEKRSGSEDRVDREAIVHLGSHIGRDDRAEIGRMSCGVELGRLWSGNFGDRDDRLDRIGSGNPP
ncbi:hypothetical protein DPMN_100948 [Dreissena polymorpha]|uniref:Uncharacterized protein n=1 Tax=Dreissena polymorpha TaxID=45954 RepID=A0A9D4LHU8_DREPO|nr:hypothetical protein DPMN_100948 [Dreissena polymorpha]